MDDDDDDDEACRFPLTLLFIYCGLGYLMLGEYDCFVFFCTSGFISCAIESTVQKAFIGGVGMVYHMQRLTIWIRGRLAVHNVGTGSYAVLAKILF